uniref:VWFA domain-containing protein n=1 Tax=Leptobrachium leishanense TaxID=445787 RepID=A0A8C5LUI5_9ANUR
ITFISAEYVNKLGRPVSSRYAHGLFHQYNNDGKIYNLTAKREHVLQKIESITGVIELFKQRLIWLTGGSRVLFGVIQEQSVAFVIDVNSLYEAQDDLCREAFCLALNEQVARISKFNLVWASEIPVKWQRKPVSASYQTVEAATQWVWNQPYSPTDRADCDAEALSLALNDQVEAIYYFSAGDIPDDKKLLMSQRISNSQFPIHVVSYNPLKPETITFWKELSHRSHGRFHVYSVENKHTVTKTTKEEYFDESNPVMEKVLPGIVFCDTYFPWMRFLMISHSAV